MLTRTLCCCFLLSAMSVNAHAGESRAETVKRIGEIVKYLSSDELEGRGVETEGIEKAATLILDEYQELGLKPGMPDGTFRQAFDIVTGPVRVSDSTKIAITAGEETKELAIRKDFQPLQRGGNGSCNADLVFVGYGISSTEDNYDDYADIDVEGKVLVMIRREPQQGKVDGAFRGTETSRHSYIATKVELAARKKAAAIILVNDPHSVADPSRDDLTSPGGFDTTSAGIPFAHVKQSVINELLKDSPVTVKTDDGEKKLNTLAAIEAHIDASMTPVSQPMDGVSAEIVTEFKSEAVKAYNLIGVVEGEGELAKEVVVIGGHYDHIGLGGYGSRARDRKGEVHNGADDNATGTAAVLEMARRVALGPKPKRTIVFICFSGEERGLLGSKHYVREPVFPLESTVAMLNFDMIGTLRNNNVEVNGVGTATEFAAIVEAVDQDSPLTTKRIDSPFAGSDHLPFYQNGIPVMFCFTGITPRYHTPDDDFETINVEGVVSVIDFTEGMLRGIDELPGRPTYNGGASNRRRRPARVPYLGVVPNMGVDQEEEGIPLRDVRRDSPADKAGLKTGDNILAVGDSATNNFSDLITFMRKSKAGDKVLFKVQRGDQVIELEATLGKPQ